jgi:hypothetical protein
VGLFIEPLEEMGMRYLVTGGVASVIYGDPRFTRDVDVVLDLPAESVPRLTEAFAGGDYYVPPEETLLAEAKRVPGGHFNIIHRDTALRADVYIAGEDPLHAWAFEHQRRLRLDAVDIWVAPPEYVIIRKLQYFLASDSDRHLRDIASMLRISGDLIHDASMSRWVEELGLAEAYARARRFQVD